MICYACPCGNGKAKKPIFSLPYWDRVTYNLALVLPPLIVTASNSAIASAPKLISNVRGNYANLVHVQKGASIVKGHFTKWTHHVSWSNTSSSPDLPAEILLLFDF